MVGTGVLLSDRYRLEEHLATGGMGDVWKAMDVVLGRVVAVKVLRPALLADPDFAARFHAEARTVAALRHPGIVGIYDYGEAVLADGTTVTYLVMEYVAGEQLDHRIAAAGRLGVAETMAVVAQAADALHAAHGGGIVHRDVKPSNLLVQSDGTVTLLDFGVARSASITRFTAVGAVVGTALYMAPEQATNGTVSAATDVYALGVVAYHCLTGSPPFTGGTPLELAIRHVHEDPPPLPDDVPVTARALVEKAMAKSPDDRYADAAALATAARTLTAASLAGQPGVDGRALLAGVAIEAMETQPLGTPNGQGSSTLAEQPAYAPRPASEPEPGYEPAPRRSRRWPVLLAALALVAAGVAAFAAFLAMDPETELPTTPLPGTSTTTRPGDGRTPTGGGGATVPGGPGATVSVPGAPTNSPVPEPTQGPTGEPEPPPPSTGASEPGPSPPGETEPSEPASSP